MRHLALLSGGQVDVTAPVRRDVPDRWTSVAGWPIWLSLALALFMVELTVRYTRLFAPRRPAARPPRAVPQTTVRPPVGEFANT